MCHHCYASPHFQHIYARTVRHCSRNDANLRRRDKTADALQHPCNIPTSPQHPCNIPGTSPHPQPRNIPTKSLQHPHIPNPTTSPHPHTARLLRPAASCVTYLLTYLLTPWCRVLLEKLTGLQLVKKFPAFHGTRRFITALTNVRQLSLSWASPIQSIYPHPTSCRSILILSTHLCLGLPSGLLPSGFPSKTLHTSLSSPMCNRTKNIQHSKKKPL